MSRPHPTLPPLSINPAVLYDQAHKTEKWCVRRGDGVDEPVHLLAFMRSSRDTPGTWQIAAYFCDSDGRVLNWRQRFDLWGENTDDALFKLMYGIENDLVIPTPIEQIRARDTDIHDSESSPGARQRFESLFT